MGVWIPLPNEVTNNCKVEEVCSTSNLLIIGKLFQLISMCQIIQLIQVFRRSFLTMKKRLMFNPRNDEITPSLHFKSCEIEAETWSRNFAKSE